MNKENSKYIIVLMLFSAVAMGCGAAKAKKESKEAAGVSVGADGERVISTKARNAFEDAVEKYKASEEMGWTKDSCDATVKAFRKVEEKFGMTEASYNVGVVYRKCKMRNEARQAFQDTLKRDPNHQLSMTQIAVMDLEDGNEQRAEDMLRKAVGAGQSSVEAVPAYVNAATILRMRGKKGKNEESFKKAEMNLRRALAIEAKYMPALYQLAMLYLDQAIAKNKSSYLTLAMLVCSQGIKLNPEYGPIYHVNGMILLQKNRLVDALKSFETAFQKDKELFASYMNFGAINLNFRGYDEAKVVFEKAILLNPQSYDAHIGLGVALRGLSDFTGAKAEYQKAAKIDGNRTDYIFNVGVLEMDYTNTGTVEGYQKAKTVFEKFISRANANHQEDPDGKGPEISWVEKAKNRSKKCDANVKMIKEAEKEMAEMEKMQKEQAKREEEMKKAMEKAKELEKKESQGATATEVPATEGAAPPAEGSVTKTDGKTDAKSGAAAKVDSAAVKDDAVKKDDASKKVDSAAKK